MPKLERPRVELFVFRAAGLTFAVGSQGVREVTRLGALTPLPRVPAFVVGAFAYRGEVLPVLDIARFLGSGELKATPRSRIFLATFERRTAAFLTDGVDGLRDVFVDEVASPESLGARSEFLSGVVSGPAGPLHLIDLGRLISAARDRVVSR